MEVFILTFIVILVAVLGMATGLLAGRSGLKGTCATLGDGFLAGLACQICPARHGDDAKHPRQCPRLALREQDDADAGARRP